MNQQPKVRKVNLNKKRSLSRLMAAQILYQYDFLKTSPDSRKIEEIKEDVIENYVLDPEEEITSYRDQIDEELLNNLITGVILDYEKIDEEIAQFLQEGFELKRLESLTHQLLRLGTFELKFFIDVPVKVVIDEYVDISASFFDLKKITFVNATLENLAKKIRAAEFEKLKK